MYSMWEIVFIWALIYVFLNPSRIKTLSQVLTPIYGSFLACLNYGQQNEFQFFSKLYMYYFEAQTDGEAHIHSRSSPSEYWQGCKCDEIREDEFVPGKHSSKVWDPFGFEWTLVGNVLLKLRSASKLSCFYWAVFTILIFSLLWKKIIFSSLNY